MSIFRTSAVIFLVIMLTLSAAGSFFYYQLMRPLIAQPVVFEIKAGEQKTQFADHLAAQKITAYPMLFTAFLYCQGKSIKRGEYLFKPQSSLYTIWQQVSRGTGFYYRSFTIVPGWTIQQLRHAFLNTPTLSQGAALQDDTAWSKKLALTTSPEGLFLPETYFYLKGTPDWAILTAAKHLMEKTLNSIWQTRANDIPFQSPYDAIIAASLIEKEAYYNDERQIIAGVLINRLKKNMRLQFDPSVIYGMGVNYNGVLYKKDLKDKTPYNTYVNKGLPPTPIALPSKQSLFAALHPMQHDYLYFVVEKEKRHRFSTTLELHEAAVKTYRKQEKTK